jgi:hypothetical protein
MSSPHDLVTNRKLMKADSYTLNLSTARWRQFSTPLPLTWKRLPFSKANRSQIPKTRGIYAFSLELPDHNLPLHSYILYVGIAGNNGSHGTLYSRYGQYLGEVNRTRARPKIVYMMTEWPNDLVFNFVEIPDAGVDLKKIENSFQDALLPIVNSRDFSASIQQARDAF